MKKKRIIIVVVILALLVSLTSCKQAGVEPYTLTEHAVAPYEIGERDKLLLDSYGVKGSPPFEYYAPLTATSIEVAIYILSDDEWVKNGGHTSSLEYGNDKEVLTRGLITIQTDFAEGKYDFKIVVKSASAVSEFSSPDLSEEYSIEAFSPQYLSSMKEIVLGQEIPIGILQYNSTGINSYSVDEFFNPESYKDIELVQAVTVTFK